MWGRGRSRRAATGPSGSRWRPAVRRPGGVARRGRWKASPSTDRTDKRDPDPRPQHTVPSGCEPGRGQCRSARHDRSGGPANVALSGDRAVGSLRHRVEVAWRRSAQDVRRGRFRSVPASASDPAIDTLDAKDPECPSSIDRPPGGMQTHHHESDEQLLERYARGSIEAREELAGRHMPMARRLASRHRRSSEPTEDLEQVAYLGLLKTIDRYDPGLGSFVGYAVTTIRGELKRHFRDHGWTMHVTRPVQERYLPGQRRRRLAQRLPGPFPPRQGTGRGDRSEHGRGGRGPGRRPTVLAPRPWTPRPAPIPTTRPAPWPTP